MDRVLSCGGLLRLCLYRSYSCTYNQNISKQKNPIQYYVALGIYMDALVCNAGTFWACGSLQVQNLSFMVSNIVSELLNHPCTLSALLGEDTVWVVPSAGQRVHLRGAGGSHLPAFWKVSLWKDRWETVVCRWLQFWRGRTALVIAFKFSLQDLRQFSAPCWTNWTRGFFPRTLQKMLSAIILTLKKNLGNGIGMCPAHPCFPLILDQLVLRQNRSLMLRQLQMQGLITPAIMRWHRTATLNCQTKLITVWIQMFHVHPHCKVL